MPDIIPNVGSTSAPPILVGLQALAKTLTNPEATAALNVLMTFVGPDVLTRLLPPGPLKTYLQANPNEISSIIRDLAQFSTQHNALFQALDQQLRG